MLTASKVSSLVNGAWAIEVMADRCATDPYNNVLIELLPLLDGFLKLLTLLWKKEV